MKSSKPSLLNLAVTSKREITSGEFESLGHGFRVKANRELDSLVKEGSGRYHWRRRPRGNGEKVFMPTNLGMVRSLLRHLEKVYMISSEEDRKNILRALVGASKVITFSSKSFIQKYEIHKQHNPLLYSDIRDALPL